jgi:hypothetical protein
MFSKLEKTTVRVIHKVRVMQLKSKKFQNTGLATVSRTIPCIFRCAVYIRCAVSIKKVRKNGKYWVHVIHKVRVIGGKIRYYFCYGIGMPKLFDTIAFLCEKVRQFCFMYCLIVSWLLTFLRSLPEANVF